MTQSGEWRIASPPSRRSKRRMPRRKRRQRGNESGIRERTPMMMTTTMMMARRKRGSVASHSLTVMRWHVTMRMGLRAVIHLHNWWRWVALPTHPRGRRM
jgi:hypothetical protein